MRHALFAGLCLLALPLASTPRLACGADAPADDAAAQCKALLAEIEAAVSAKDDGKVTAAVKKVPPLYKSTQDQAARGPLLKELGSLVKQTKLESARRAALNAIVEAEDAKEGTKILMAVYPKDDVEDIEKFNCDIVKAIGALHADSAIPALVETFKKAKQPDLSAEAVTALGNYGKSKQREKVLEEIYKAGKNMVPPRSAGAGGGKVSPETQARWQAVAPAIGKALDTLTGDSVGDPAEWFKRIGDAKSLKTLFKN